MPWHNKEDVASHNKIAAKYPKLRRLWIKVANSHLASHPGDDARAIRIANAVVLKHRIKHKKGSLGHVLRTIHAAKKRKRMKTREEGSLGHVKRIVKAVKKRKNNVHSSVTAFTVPTLYHPKSNAQRKAGGLKSHFDSGFNRIGLAHTKSSHEPSSKKTTHIYHCAPGKTCSKDALMNMATKQGFVKTSEAPLESGEGRTMVHSLISKDGRIHRLSSVIRDGKVTSLVHAIRPKPKIVVADDMSPTLEMEPADYNISDTPGEVTAANPHLHAPKINKYTVNKIKRDHANFIKVLQRHFTGKPFKWHKILTKRSLIHRFLHPAKHSPVVSIKRQHVIMEPHYIVRVRHPSHIPGKNAVYNRAIRTKSPSKTLDIMLKQARIAFEHHKNVHKK